MVEEPSSNMRRSLPRVDTKFGLVFCLLPSVGFLSHLFPPTLFVGIGLARLVLQQ